MRITRRSGCDRNQLILKLRCIKRLIIVGWPLENLSNKAIILQDNTYFNGYAIKIEKKLVS